MVSATINEYDESAIKTLKWWEHIRIRPGMYIGKTGDGSSPEDGIYVLLKEIIDNSIDEFVMGNGKQIHIKIHEKRVSVRDFGRGIPFGKLIECVSSINTGGKYDSRVFKKSVGLNGVGTKAVNALSNSFKIISFRDGKKKEAEFERGILTTDNKEAHTDEPNGTFVSFIADDSIFRNYRFIPEFIENQLKNYCYLNAGLTIVFNDAKFQSKNGLLDLLTSKTNAENNRYPIIHLKGSDDIEVALTHASEYGEEYYSFVNGQHTTQGGTHLNAFKEAIVKTVREFFKKDFDVMDIRASIVAAVSVRIQEPQFESQTKTRLGSSNTEPDGAGVPIRQMVIDFMKKELDNFLHKHPETADAMLKRILQSERERKEISGIRKLANDRARKASLHNKKLRDCRFHLGEDKNDKAADTTLFITEGDSASGSITKARDVETQAVFSLRGKPLNVFGLTKKVVYENEEFNLLQHALNIEEGIEYLRYNRIIVATDADVDGLHIRLLLITFFLQFFPDLVKNGHVFILNTPLFRVRNKTKTIYCYNTDDKAKALKELGITAEITRFKGLGEISPDEFGLFIGSDIKLDPVYMKAEMNVAKMLEYYMGKNTPVRQTFIIDNLRTELDSVEEAA